MDERCLLFLVKDPTHGRVKTRLASSIGTDTTQNLYTAFIHDLLSKFENKPFPFFICFYPEDALRGLKKLLGEQYSYLPQKGDDLGQRMEYCFHGVFSKGFQHVIAIGSDVPDLPAEIIDDAFGFLARVDCVIGPSFDGGYYLIGFRRHSFLPQVFTGIEWGTEVVLKKTTEIVRRHHLRTQLLRTWRDIDTVEDLRQLFEKNKNTSLCPQTMTYLQSLKIPYLKDIK